MGIIIVKSHPETNVNYLENAIAYIIRGKARLGFFGSPNTSFDSVEEALFQMTKVKEFYGKTEFNPLFHIVVSFDVEEVFDPFTALDIAPKICEFFSYDFQVLWAVHYKPQYDCRENIASEYHIHILVNSVSYRDGKMLDFNFGIQNALRARIKELTDTKHKDWKIRFKTHSL